ncbi:MAG: DNA polymerase I [bacterium]
MKKLVLIDGMALIFKAYFAFMRNPLSSSKGEPTSAIYGFINQLLKILEDTKPDYIGIALDSKEPTFRHIKYAEYKAHRDAIPEDLIPQIARVKEIIKLFNIPAFIFPGYEADDIIGTILKKTSKADILSYAITPDKDFMQLVDKNLFIIKPGKSADELLTYDTAKVNEEYGFSPIQMIDYLALIGDASDNIPGVKGIGEKTAVPLIQKYGSIENIYQNIELIDKNSVKEKLIINRDNAFLSKELATIFLDVPIEYNLKELEITPPDFEGLKQVFDELDLKSFGPKLNKIFKSENIEISKSESVSTTYNAFSTNDVSYKLITSYDEASKLAEKLSKEDLFVFDTETDGLNVFNVNLAGVSFCFESKKAFFIAVDPDVSSDDLFSEKLTDRLNINDFIKLFKPIFENENIKKVCQNAKYDIAVLRKYNIIVKNLYFDTMLASYILDPDQKHNMDDLARVYLNYSPIPLSDILGVKKDALKIFSVDKNLLSNYSCEDADITFQLYKRLEADLKKEKLDKLAFDVEFSLVEVLLEMEKNGVKIDVSMLNLLSVSMGKDLFALINSIHQLAGEEFNINSTQQLQQILFTKLNLATQRKTKTGFSTDAQSLEQLKGEHEIIDLLIDYRELAKLKSTYVDALPRLINPATGRLHTTFNQTVASTGRLSSLNPNLQNIPVRGALGKDIRRAFIPEDNKHIFLCADYNQIELRIMASICNDPYLTDAFKNNIDIHTRTAELVFGVNAATVTPDMRRKAKEVNFGILYGIGAFGLKNRLQITQYHAKEIIDNYFATFKNVKQFMDDAIVKAQEKGYAETLLGRRRYLKNINSKNRVLRQFEERVAINMPIQGTAADMIKIAMINIYKEMKNLNFRSKMVLQVHDELIFDAQLDEIEKLKPIVKKLMENALPLNIPVIASLGTGNNWLDAH